MICFQNESIYIQKTHLLYDACKTSNVFSPLCIFFIAKSYVSVPFSWQNLMKFAVDHN